jgi:tetratricopeptide (TPR) repeat protein
MMPEGQRLSVGQALDAGTQAAIAGDHPGACGWFQGVLMHEPENFEAIERLGASLFALSRYHEALYWFWRGLKLQRRHPLALTNYGMCVAQLGHWEEGLADLNRAVYHAEKAGPRLTAGAKSMIYNNLGNTLERLNRHAEALVALDRGIALDPSDAFPHYNRGIALLRLGRYHEAIRSLNRSLELHAPTDTASRLNEADTKYNIAVARLLLGDFERAWPDYEYRLLTSNDDRHQLSTPKPLNLGLPAEKKWTGQDVAGERILVHAEQGQGDTIQFLRFLPPLIARGADVQMVCHNGLKPIAAQVPGVRVLEPGIIPNDSYDYWVAHMSLPLLLGMKSEADIPPPWWPEQDPALVETWRVRLEEILAARGAHPDRPRVGLVWSGNWQHKNDRHRSIALGTFGKLFDAPCNFVSLQQIRDGELEEFAALRDKHNLTALWMPDWRDTAAAVSQLDLVVTVDTAVAHLAATVGTPTWILVPKMNVDWRWQLRRTDSPWYPAVRLFRQETIGDWPSVIARVRQDLAALTTRSAAAA